MLNHIIKPPCCTPTGPKDTHPPTCIEVPDKPPLPSLPKGVTCGQVVGVPVDGTYMYTFPTLNSGSNAPSHCALVLVAPEGYGFEYRLPDLPLSSR